MSSCSSQPDYEVGYLTKGNPDNSYLDSCETYCCGDQMEELEDIFKTKQFQELPWKQRLWIRIKVAFFGMLEMM